MSENWLKEATRQIGTSAWKQAPRPTTRRRLTTKKSYRPRPRKANAIQPVIKPEPQMEPVETPPQTDIPYPVNHWFRSNGNGRRRWVTDSEGRNDMTRAQQAQVKHDLATGRAYLVRRPDLDR